MFIFTQGCTKFRIPPPGRQYQAFGEEGNGEGKKERQEVKEIFPSRLHLQKKFGERNQVENIGLGKEIKLRGTSYTPD